MRTTRHFVILHVLWSDRALAATMRTITVTGIIQTVLKHKSWPPLVSIPVKRLFRRQLKILSNTSFGELHCYILLQQWSE